MEVVEVKAYKCQYCGSVFLSSFDAGVCEAMCEANADSAKAYEDGYEDGDF